MSSLIWNESKHRPSLKEAQDFVDGYVEHLELKDGVQMLINDEGLYRDDLPVNDIATKILKESGYRMVAPIKGKCIILSGSAVWT